MEKILRYALIISAIGIMILYTISVTVKIPEKALCDPNLEIDSMITVNGIVAKTYQTNKTTTLYLENCSTASIFIFKKMDITPGMNINAIGKVGFSYNHTQLLAEKITVKES